MTKGFQLIHCGLSVATVMATGAMAADVPAVYPIPQESKWTEDTVKVTTKPAVVIRSAKTANNKLLKGVPKKSGAYRLVISKTGKIGVGAHDARGAFYAHQTLKQLGYGKEGVKLPVGNILDYPDIEYRGTVEGFYGTPWSHESRISQLKFYGETKMNTYIYGPKDDPYHSSPHWRKPYPADEAAQIKELVEVAKENHVDFVWAIHPGKDIKWTDEDMGNVIKKFEMMYKLGVRSFAVFFDDIFGEGTKADKQAMLMNKIHNEFVKKKKDVTPLIMCPTEYNKGWANHKPGTYLDILGDKLDPSIHVMWTGNSVCHDITFEGQKWVNNRIKRPSYVWWNFPVTDYCRASLCMGRTYGNTMEPGSEDTMSGFVSNPMDKPEASKIPLFGVADYSWNIYAYDSDKAWKEGVKRLFPDAAEAMQVFVNHNSDQGPNGHGYRREESVEIKPVVDKVMNSINSATLDLDSLRLLEAEFVKMKSAAPVIRDKANNPRLMKEIGAWVDAFEQLGIAGENISKSLLQEGNSKAVEYFVKGTNALTEMNIISQEHNKKGVDYQSEVHTGHLVMTPATQKLAEYAGAKIYASITGGPAISPKPIVKGGNADNAKKYLDGDRNSFWHSGHYGQKGDYYGIDYGTPMPIRCVEVLMGRHNDDGDYVEKGQLEGTNDLKTWVPLGPETSGRQVFWQSKEPVSYRALRYRVITPRSVGNGRTVWTAIREFAVNAPPAAIAETNIKGLSGLATQKDDKLVRIARVMETHKMQPGDYISLKLDGPTDATWLEVNFDREDVNDWAEVTLDVEGSDKPVVQRLDKSGKNFIARAHQLPKGIKGMKLVNKGNQAKDIVLNMFKFDVPPSDPTANAASLTDHNLQTVYVVKNALDLEVENLDNPKTTKVAIVGAVDCQVEARVGKNDKWKSLGSVKSADAVTEFKVPAGTSAVRLLNPIKKKGFINEVIFK